MARHDGRSPSRYNTRQGTGEGSEHHHDPRTGTGDRVSAANSKQRIGTTSIPTGRPARTNFMPRTAFSIWGLARSRMSDARQSNSSMPGGKSRGVRTARHIDHQFPGPCQSDGRGDIAVHHEPLCRRRRADPAVTAGDHDRRRHREYVCGDDEGCVALRTRTLKPVFMGGEAPTIMTEK